MDPSIQACTDDKLREHNTTEHSCECPALHFKSKVFTCPWTGDQICRHIYRYRLKLRLANEEDRFDLLIETVTQLYGEQAAATARQKMVPRLLRDLRKEVARVEPPPAPPLPRKKKEREAELANRQLWAELQELRVC